MIDLAEGYTCKECDTYHRFATWVYAHWDKRMVHTCDNCLKSVVIYQGETEGD